MADPIDEAWVRRRLVTYGHSFPHGTGLPDPAGYYPQIVADRFGMTYPTDGTVDLNRAVGGSYAEAAADVMLTGQPWTSSKRLGGDTVLLIQALINTARKNGVDVVTRQGAEHALRTMCALGSSLEVIPDSADLFDYSAAWSTVTSADFHGGSYRTTTTANHYVVFTVPADGCHFLTAARKAGVSPVVLEVMRLDTGEVIRTWTNESQAQAGIARNYVPAAIPLRVPTGTRVRVRLLSGYHLVCDGLIVPANRPAPIVLMKEPYLEDYSLSTAFPNGSDEAIDYFNELVDVMAGEFPNVLTADPNTAGYWDKTTHILPDGVHPNAAGHQALADTLVDAVRAQLVVKSYAAGLTV